jgi:hypothetical protein
LISSNRLEPLSLSYQTSLKLHQWIILHADLGKCHGGFGFSADSWHASTGPFQTIKVSSSLSLVSTLAHVLFYSWIHSQSAHHRDHLWHRFIPKLSSALKWPPCIKVIGGRRWVPQQQVWRNDINQPNRNWSYAHGRFSRFAAPVLAAKSRGFNIQCLSINSIGVRRLFLILELLMANFTSNPWLSSEGQQSFCRWVRGNTYFQKVSSSSRYWNNY